MDIKIFSDFIISFESIPQLINLIMIILFILNMNKQKKKIDGLENIMYKYFGDNISAEIKEKIDKLSESGEIPLRILNNYFNIHEKRSIMID